ncbi:hypothetical protein PAXRUDRAFT_825260 [Paxillus rubicundulus Ve08.2h10]|uniref:Calcineurin-like phosphoesterase domain-containing protein n=1 Tax=Paxillus rubicundulus Ve08.2h10 TaxID=930991 RepID=A0A0D0DGM3_9AGAM|nr:hypothetical protein PAXRUDRAFT_825260 [Paxillus rubicundulus Ve08.2h10]
MRRLYERRSYKPPLCSRKTIILGLRFLWVILVIWCEFGAFFYALSDCRWPDKALRPIHAQTKPTRVLLITDAQLQNPAVPARSWLGCDSNTAYLRRSWSAVSRLHPNVVIFLGDTLASGRYVTSDKEYGAYFRAFEEAFPRDASVPFYFIPGNNDIGLGESPSFSKDARRFFQEHFGPLNQVVSIADHKFVLLDAPKLVEEDYRRHAHGITYDQWTPLPGGPIELLMSISGQEERDPAQPKIILSHIPLSRPSSKSCGPLREKGSIRAGAGHGYQTMLGKQTTEFLMKTLQPSLVFSGDNRDYCEVTHEIPTSDVNTTSTIREVTVKSFSPNRHIHRPGFQLLSLIPPSSATLGSPTFADAPCHLPDTLRTFRSIYLPCLVLTSIVLLYLNISPSGHRRRFSVLSTTFSTRDRPSSPLPQSAIWSTWSPNRLRVRTSPTSPLPLSTRIPSTKAIPSYRASPIATPQSSPLLSPITLFPPEDEAEAEDQMSPSHYTHRRDPHHPLDGGCSGEDEGDPERDNATSAAPSRRTAYFLPPPTSQHARNGWAYSWTFVFWGRRRRMTVALPRWSTWRGRLWGAWPSLRRRGRVWRFFSDCVGVALPAVVARSVFGWLLL